MRNSALQLTSSSGFTLLEMLVSVTILLLITGGGVASYLSLNDRQTLVMNGKKLQFYMRAAQKKAHVGDKPTACDTLQGYVVTATTNPGATVQLSARCANGDYVDQSFVLPSDTNSVNAINMIFGGLRGGVTGADTVTLHTTKRNYSFTVGAGGDISEGTLTNL